MKDYESPVEESAVEIDVHFNQAVPHEHRDIVERSVRTMAEHSAKERDRTRAAEAQYTKLAAAINAPLTKLVKQDPEAIKEFEGLLAQHQLSLDFDLPSMLHPEMPIEIEEANLVLRDIQTRIHPPPYHFEWKWHRLDGSPPFNTFLSRPAGEVGVEARSGPFVPGSGGKFVEAHAGFGLFFRATANGLLSGDSSRLMTWAFVVGAFGIGSNATSEGGTECTILEDGQLKAHAAHRLWRKRVSVGEFETGRSPGIITDTPMRIQFPMRAGHEYTFNVGVWAYTDNTAGVGTSGAISAIRGRIPGMIITRPE